jgi:hypothetical protein
MTSKERLAAGGMTDQDLRRSTGRQQAQAFLTAQASNDAALDKLRTRYGRKVIYYGSVQESRDKAPMRISFTHIPDAGLEGD